jgi:ATP-dependent DNA helicase RecG
LSSGKRSRAFDFIKREIDEGGRAYFICPAIENEEEGETAGAALATVYDCETRLKESVFKDVPMGILHGKMKNADKERVMADFASGKIKILIATTVVEVGVNVSEANVMAVENAERFGLSQLHQLRAGWGGRKKSYCLLFSDDRKKRREPG